MNHESTHQAIDGAASAADHADIHALGVAQRGVNALRDGSQHMLDRANRAGENTVAYVRDEPMKAMLMAAAAGATLMALLSLMTRSRE